MRHVVILGSDSGIRGRGEGSERGEGRDEPIDSQPKPWDSEEEDEEDEEEEFMADQNLEWMTYGPLALPSALHRMPKHSQRMVTKYDLDRAAKVEDHLDNLYLQLKTLEV